MALSIPALKYGDFRAFFIKTDNLRVAENDILIPLDNHAIPARIYTPERTNGKCLIFVHGGAFMLEHLIVSILDVDI